MGKNRGIGRGGARPGAGRKKGSRDVAPRMRAEILGHLEEVDQKLPLYELLDRVRDETLDPKYRDLLRIQILPYMHPRLRSDLTAKPFYLMSPEELEKVERAQLEHEKQVARGRGHLRVIPKGGR
jgi:hypothetical protein